MTCGDVSEAKEEESWTFLGADEPNPEMVTKRLEMHGADGGENGHGPEMGTPSVGSWGAQ